MPTHRMSLRYDIMLRCLALVALALVALAWCGPAWAQPRPDQDWPCVQRKVPTISAGAVWSGPELPPAGEWGQDFDAAALARALASRRTDLDEADRRIEAFAKEAGAEAGKRLTRVFAGVLDFVNQERSSILAGIERYARGQRLLAERLRQESDTISAAKDAPGATPTADIKDIENRFAWDKRIFEERRQSLTYVCETPVLLEQRVFEIARRIQQRL
jgi:hypothetical protein